MSTQPQLFDKISNDPVISTGNTGNLLMASGDTVSISPGVYKAGLFTDEANMFALSRLFGTLECRETLLCSLDGGGSVRRVMMVTGTGPGVLKVKGIRVVNGAKDVGLGYGGGVYVNTGSCGSAGEARVDFVMCSFEDNEANVSEYNYFLPLFPLTSR